MIVYYFGADKAWEDETALTINRRNMAVLLALAEHHKIEQVYNIIRCTRALVFNKKQQKVSQHPKIINVYIAPIFPEKGVLKVVTRKLNKWYLKRLNRLELKNCNNGISWCYWPKGYLDYKFLGLNNTMIFDTDHNIIEDPNLLAKDKVERKRLLLNAAKDAQWILSSARSMLNWYKQHDIHHSVLMLNGVFTQRQDLSQPKLSKPFTLTYCGTLSKWIKVDWLLKMAEEQPDWTINIIGKNYKTDFAQTFSNLCNIKQHGFLKPQEVDALIKQSHVCLGLYEEHKALDVNSMKLYDYLMQGKPVVVNQYHDNLTKDFKGHLMVASNYNDFIESIEHPKNPNLEKLKQFLQEVTWQNRINHVLNILPDA